MCMYVCMCVCVCACLWDRLVSQSDLYVMCDVFEGAYTTSRTVGVQHKIFQFQFHMKRLGSIVWCVMCDVRCVVCDVWCMMHARDVWCVWCVTVWCVMCDVWLCDVRCACLWCVMHDVCDIWCMICSVWCTMCDVMCDVICDGAMYDVWCVYQPILWMSCAKTHTHTHTHTPKCPIHIMFLSAFAIPKLFVRWF